MQKAIMMVLGFLIAISTAADGPKQCSVSGEIRFNGEKGQVIVWLLTQDEYESRIKPATPARCLP
jgi:hypothetical protein